MSLYHKYRPSNFRQVKGNKDVVSALEVMLGNIETCPHSFLFSGPTGCGKTTLGRIVASNLNSHGDDFREVDSADFRGIDTIREIRKNSTYKAIQSEHRVWLIDECHKLTDDAQNALLKILEDSPKHVYFILCTTRPQKLLSEIKGRCQQFVVTPLTEIEMKGLLNKIVIRENETLDEIIYEHIIQDSQGHPRNAIQILEQVLSVPPENRLEVAKKAESELFEVNELCRALIKKGTGWKEVRTILAGLQNQEPEGIRRMVLGYCKSILLKSDNPLCGLIMEEFVNPFYDSGFPQLVLACYTIIKNK